MQKSSRSWNQKFLYIPGVVFSAFEAFSTAISVLNPNRYAFPVSLLALHFKLWNGKVPRNIQDYRQ